MTQRGWGRQHLLIACEHASNRLPKRYGTLGLTRAQLASHSCWDPGAGPVARALARRFGAPLLEGTHARVLADLNRSAHNRDVIPPVCYGTAVPGNQGLSRADRRRRLAEHHAPYYEQVAAAVVERIAQAGECFFLSIHSFTPVYRGQERNCDFGLMYDPRLPREKAAAVAIAGVLRATGVRVRMNYPYRGVEDACVTVFRKRHAARRYTGIQVELNHGTFRTAADWRRAGKMLGDALEAVLTPKKR
jgi:predicted N-formylglutamate amidohydrolase